MKIHDVEQGSPEWDLLRAGIPTASNATLLVSGTGKESTSINEYAELLAAELYAGKPLDGFQGNQYTDMGNDLEHDARLKYERISGMWVEQVGFCTTDDESYGCSPDGLVEEDGLVEIKSLIAKNFMKVLMYYDKHKKAMPKYVSQPQMQMLVTGRKWCDLAFYHPELGLFIIKQKPIQEIQEMIIRQIAECLRIRDNTLEIIKANSSFAP